MKEKKSQFKNKIEIKNRKAFYEFEILEKFEAGIILLGTEIKSIREGKASLQESYCFIQKNELIIKGMNISPYSMASFKNHEMTRDRKLLLKKIELKKLKSKSEEKGLSIVPLRVYLNNRGLAKIEIALSKGKKLYDKRDDIKKKDQKRELERLRI